MNLKWAQNIAWKNKIMGMCSKGCEGAILTATLYILYLVNKLIDRSI